jgi:pimeloyl-ACP methyl ester carboxylesterase
MVFLAAFLPEPGSSMTDQRSREPLDPDIEFATAEFTDLGDGVYEIGANTATQMFYHDASVEMAEWAVQRLRRQSYRFMNEVTPLQTWPKCQSEYIVCVDDQGINPQWCRRAATQRLNVTPHEIEGGHSPFLTRPAELADILHRIAVDAS